MPWGQPILLRGWIGPPGENGRRILDTAYDFSSQEGWKECWVTYSEICISKRCETCYGQTHWGLLDGSAGCGCARRRLAEGCTSYAEMYRKFWERLFRMRLRAWVEGQIGASAKAESKFPRTRMGRTDAFEVLAERCREEIRKREGRPFQPATDKAIGHCLFGREEAAALQLLAEAYFRVVRLELAYSTPEGRAAKALAAEKRRISLEELRKAR